MKECDNCLSRLKTDYIYLFRIHWHDNSKPINRNFGSLAAFARAGKILAAGVCNYTATQMKVAENVISLVSNQVPYSMVLRDIEKELVPYCIGHKKAIIAYCCSAVCLPAK